MHKIPNERIKQFFGSHGVEYQHQPGGFGDVEVLPFLKGRPCDDFLLAYLGALRPSCIRIVHYNQAVTCDQWLWRVTVVLDPEERVLSISQEVEFGSCKPFTCGYEIQMYLETGEIRKLPEDGVFAIYNVRGVKLDPEKA